MSDLYSRLTQAGNVRILGDHRLNVGDAAIMVDAPSSPVKYQNVQYNTAEEVNMGLGGRFLVAAAPSPVASTTVQLPTPNTSLPFMTMRVTIPSSVSLYFMLNTAKIAAIDLIDGEAICGDIFSEVSLNNGVRWPTAQTGQQFQITISNTDDTAAHEPRVSITGIRLRP